MPFVLPQGAVELPERIPRDEGAGLQRGIFLRPGAGGCVEIGVGAEGASRDHANVWEGFEQLDGRNRPPPVKHREGACLDRVGRRRCAESALEQGGPLGETRRPGRDERVVQHVGID